MVLGVCFFSLARVVMGRVLISRTRVQFPRKLFEYVRWSCLNIYGLMYNLQKICIQFKFEILQCICSIHIHSFLAFKNPAHS